MSRLETLSKIRQSVSRYGLRGGLQDCVARWGQSKLRVPQDVLGDYGWVLGPSRPPVLQPPSFGPLTMNWLLPDLAEGSGGLLNIFRAIHHLERWGHRHRIYIVGRNTTAAQAREAIRKHYFPIEAEIELFNGATADSDALIATHWSTAYVARSLQNTSGKFYFVQDLEYLFFASGSLHEFAKHTYQWGFRGITLGAWIAHVLQSEFGMPCTPFGFSYDRGIYSQDGPRHYSDDKRRVLFYARPRTERRGFELGILALSMVARKMPDVDFVLVGFPPQSMRLPFRAVLPGVLAPSQLAALYRSCSVALVLSHTNVSLLPLELMACNCPVVSNTGPNVEWLLTPESTEYGDPNPESLANAILRLFNDDQLRARRIREGRVLAERTDWLAEIKVIESALYRGLGVEYPQKDKVGLS